jgi:hypothetical protein
MNLSHAEMSHQGGGEVAAKETAMERKPQKPASEQTIEPELQQSGQIGRARDDLLKRAIKQHPRREIPKIEDVDPSEAPAKE